VEREALPARSGCTGSEFVADPIRDAAALATQLASPVDGLSKSRRAALPSKIRKQLSPQPGVGLKDCTPVVLVRALNKLAQGPSLYDPVRFPENLWSPKTRAFREEHPQPKGRKLALFNRWIMILQVTQAPT
jgi:hypothetical protein